MPYRGTHHTEESKQKLSISKLGSKNPMFGKVSAHRKIFLTRDELYQLYVEEKRTLSDLGKQFSVENTTIAMWLKRYGIRLLPEQLKGRLRPERQHRYNGHKWENNNYILLFNPDHPRAVKGYVQEHRLIVEKYIGRLLADGENVHHINMDKKDNRIENFILFAGVGEHTAFHHWMNRVGAYHLGLMPSPPDDIVYDHPVLISGKWVDRIGMANFNKTLTA